jgi:hypothetical protein
VPGREIGIETASKNATKIKGTGKLDFYIYIHSSGCGPLGASNPRRAYGRTQHEHRYFTGMNRFLLTFY